MYPLSLGLSFIKAGNSPHPPSKPNVVIDRAYLNTLVPKASFEPERSIRMSAFNTEIGALFAVDFIGLNGTNGGVIAEFGGAGIGAVIGFAADGTFVARVGDSNFNGPGVSKIMTNTNVPNGDGTLAFYFQGAGKMRVRVFWNGNEVGESVESQVGSSVWAGGNDASYMKVGGNMASSPIAQQPIVHNGVGLLEYYKMPEFPE